jgi:hypothetical protein
MMAGRRSGLSGRKGRKAKKQQTVKYLLEVGTLESMRAAKQRTQDLLDYHWAHYSELAHQRNQNIEAIKKALISSSVSDFKFEGWQRAVKYKYSLHPLGTRGSLANIGGRFNTGVDVNSNVPTHPALYIAEDKDTALQETLGQEPDETGQLTPQEIALTNPQSETIVSVSGSLEKIFDLRSHRSLNALIAIIKHFKFSDAILKKAKALKFEAPRVIQASKELRTTLLAKNWRAWPENLDVPANPQVFGHLLFIAGIEGVIYPSKLTGRDCMAIFVHNFSQSSSFIQIDGEIPHARVPRRIDGKNWQLCDFNFEDFSDAGAILQ